jgi:hypothetical protein
MIISKPSDLVQGTLDTLLLKILALEPLNGFAVSRRLKQVSGDVLQVSDRSLYPALHKLEQEGWITAEWNVRIWSAREILFAHAVRAATARKRSRLSGAGFRARFRGLLSSKRRERFAG